LSAVVRDAGIEISRLMGYRPFVEPPKSRARRSVAS